MRLLETKMRQKMPCFKLKKTKKQAFKKSKTIQVLFKKTSPKTKDLNTNLRWYTFKPLFI